ncbi:MAG: helix-turn-helix domain-containing protein [Pseudomonas sp.]|jgi:DNA-binding PucR family transcriptional regulator|uniref:helix-turn-helix domain-containing protein n=1 Tax=Pseudomonas sp. TaxID=306 RepID=UPI002391DB12|nr:helix-turn-helix domain-containing protein [Pseudomonas sp.]MDP9030428.1 helix-turn-helix domain-containing protein [Pseudomonadota bacterium]MDE1911483.1 helix-turn-helix domain-containing protein [Pseudomonas sp.]MDE2194314.1 helix-turn-helix domain-containing protein [Pseudomonas sp.]MDE2559467.1 helix-turn-helix domain-containing protein [Pseudomonas sp.]MDP9062480.1 helix-turn-helix domain-containing protein [Pseudomonadota bacterium]
MQILSLRDVASQINSGGDLQSMLHQLVYASCRHTHWTMSSIMAIDMDAGFGHVIARHDPTLVQRPLVDCWELSSSPVMTALQRNEAVFIRDVRECEYPGYRRESLERDYRTVMVMPMNCTDFDGRPMVLSVISRTLMDVSEEDRVFLGMIIHLGAIAVERQRQLEAEHRAAERLQQALHVHTTMLEHVLGGGSVTSLSLMVGDQLPNPVIAVDFTANQVVAGRSPDPALFDDNAWQAAVAGVLSVQITKAAQESLRSALRSTVNLFLDDGQRQFTLRAQIEPLMVDHELVGALVLFPVAAPVNELDLLMLESAKFALSVQMMRSFIRFRFETRTQTELLLEVLEGRWRDADDIQQRAQRLGISFSTAQQMIIVDYGAKAREAKNLHHNVARILQRAGMQATVIIVDNGLVCLVPAEGERLSKIKRQITDDLAHYLGAEPILLASGVCRALADYPAAWERCRRLIEIARSFGRSGPISDQDFGPIPIFVAAVGGEDIRTFVNDSVGAMLAHDRKHQTPYLETLTAYLRESCRSQACADAMGVHVTTLRYRLARIQELFGIDVETPERRFATELAIHLQRVIEGFQKR